MYTYAVITSTEGTGPIEIYRGTDGNAAIAAYRSAIPTWMTEDRRKWQASGYSPEYGHGSVEIGIVCEVCGGASDPFGYYCGHCGADIP